MMQGSFKQLKCRQPEDPFDDPMFTLPRARKIFNKKMGDQDLVKRITRDIK